MNLKIGEKIKQLREKNNVTQNKMAEYLGITEQAISRWENSAGYPDIEILPAIANFFNITIDELMCFDITKKEERIIEILNHVSESINREATDKNAMDETIEILRKGLQEFPNNYILLSRLAGSFWNKTWEMKNSGNDEEMRRYANETVQIYELLLSDWEYAGIHYYYGSMPNLEHKYGYTYESVRYDAIQGLAYTYFNFLDDTEKAVEWANKLPNIDCTKEIILAHVLKDEEKLIQVKWNIFRYSGELKYYLNVLAECEYSNSDMLEEIKRYKEIVAELEKYAKEVLI
ncbi:MAG: helix-turn-helix domain-containing protein [Oscillospiraceae bacterium]|nr:helix-turn-helix domain-containing protein [Oscillospiraceae bacterium]